MPKPREISLHIELDGPRSRSFPLPDDWWTKDPDQRKEWLADKVAELRNDALSWHGQTQVGEILVSADFLVYAEGERQLHEWAREEVPDA